MMWLNGTLQRPLEARQVGAAEPLLAGTVQHVQPVVAGRQLVGQLPGTVG